MKYSEHVNLEDPAHAMPVSMADTVFSAFAIMPTMKQKVELVTHFANMISMWGKDPVGDALEALLYMEDGRPNPTFRNPPYALRVDARHEKTPEGHPIGKWIMDQKATRAPREARDEPTGPPSTKEETRAGLEQMRKALMDATIAGGLTPPAKYSHWYKKGA